MSIENRRAQYLKQLERAKDPLKPGVDPVLAAEFGKSKKPKEKPIVKPSLVVDDKEFPKLGPDTGGDD